MLHPSYSELMNVVNQNAAPEDRVVKSRYSIVMGTAKRARQLVDNGYMTLDDHSVKPLSIAVDELNDGRIRIISDEEAAALSAEKAAAAAEAAGENAEEEVREASAPEEE